MSTKQKVVVAMSGGVDSSVAAALLQQQNYDCLGVFMRLGHDPAEESAPTCSLPQNLTPSPTHPLPHPTQSSVLSPQSSSSHKQGCCSSSDASDARFVAGLLNIPFYALNFQPDFNQIIDYFVAEYNAGRTPNPCVRCNEYLKFGKLARYARAVGADFVATGHYARVHHNTQTGESHLLRAADPKKDQSYVLFGIPRDELPRMLLPLGELEKPQVRQLAHQFGLPVHNKPDSQEICFVPDNNYPTLLHARSPNSLRPGNFIDPAGNVLGQHPGHQHFTLGQRKGTGIALGNPAYVAAIDPIANTVTLAPRAALLHRTLTARQVNWLAGPPSPVGPQEPLRVLAKVRYNSPPTLATALMTGPDELTVRFDDPVLAITPGQAVVCYEENSPRLLGGAWIHGVSD